MISPHAENWLGQWVFSGDLVVRQTQASDWEQKIGRVQDNGKVVWFAVARGRWDEPATIRKLDRSSRIPKNTNLHRVIVLNDTQVSWDIRELEESLDKQP